MYRKMLAKDTGAVGPADFEVIQKLDTTVSEWMTAVRLSNLKRRETNLVICFALQSNLSYVILQLCPNLSFVTFLFLREHKRGLTVYTRLDCIYNCLTCISDQAGLNDFYFEF